MKDPIVHSLIVAPEPGPYRASLTDTADGVLVRLSRDDRPHGARLISVTTIDAPMHRVASRVHDALTRLNRRTNRTVYHIFFNPKPRGAPSCLYLTNSTPPT